MQRPGRVLLARLQTAWLSAAAQLLPASAVAETSGAAWQVSGAAERPAARTGASIGIWLGFAAAGAGLAVSETQAGNGNLNPESLAELTQDLLTGAYYDKERAVSMLSGLTLYIDYHDALLASDVLPALMQTVCTETVEPTVRVVALGCTADLFKSGRAHAALRHGETFLETVVQCLQGGEVWERGPEQGGLAKSHAARLLAELAGDEQMHDLLISSGAAAAIADRSLELAQASASENKRYENKAAVPGTSLELHAVDEERYSAAACSGLVASHAGSHFLLQHNQGVMEALRSWTNSKDPILQRYGAAALAHMAVSEDPALAAAVGIAGLRSLIAALTQTDPQANCYAASAIGKIAGRGGQATAALVQQGAATQLLAMLNKHNTPMTIGPDDKRVGTGSIPVQKAVQRSALRCLIACSQNPQMQQALAQSGASQRLQAVISSLNPTSDSELSTLAKQALARFNAPS